MSDIYIYIRLIIRCIIECIVEYLKSLCIITTLLITISGLWGFLWCKTKLGITILLLGVGLQCIVYYSLGVGLIIGVIPLGVFTISFLEKLTFIEIIRLLLLDYPVVQISQRSYRIGLFYYSGFDKNELSTKIMQAIILTLCGVFGCPYLGFIIIIRYFGALITLNPMTFGELRDVISSIIIKQSQAQAVSYNQRLYYYHYRLHGTKKYDC